MALQAPCKDESLSALFLHPEEFVLLHVRFKVNHRAAGAARRGEGVSALRRRTSSSVRKCAKESRSAWQSTAPVIIQKMASVFQDTDVFEQMVGHPFWSSQKTQHTYSSWRESNFGVTVQQQQQTQATNSAGLHHPTQTTSFVCSLKIEDIGPDLEADMNSCVQGT